MTSRRQVGERLSERVIRECARAQDPLRLLERVAALVRAEIPYAVAGWLLIDPETLLINGVHAESVAREQHLALIECELTEDDQNKFFDLAAREVPAASLSATTGESSRAACGGSGSTSHAATGTSSAPSLPRGPPPGGTRA